MNPTDPTNFTAVLTWLLGFGGPYVTGKIFSYLAENWTKWHDLPRWLKFTAPLIASILIAIGATLLLQHTELVAVISPWWSIVSAAALAYLGTQQGYMDTRKADYGRSARNAELVTDKDVPK